MEPSIITFNSIIEYFNLEKLKKILGFTFKAKFRQIDYYYKMIYFKLTFFYFRKYMNRIH